MRSFLQRWFARPIVRDVLIGLALCLLVCALLVVTSGSAPQFIYQGF